MVPKFDAFIILSSERFTEIDSKIAKAVQERGKKYFFCRSKFDHAVSDTERQYKKAKRKFEKSKVEEEIREDSRQNLTGVEGWSGHIYLLDNHDDLAYDFNKLKKDILDALPAIKSEALALTMEMKSKELLQIKMGFLRSRLWMTAAKSAAIGTIPLPGVSAVYDVKIIREEVDHQRKQLGIDEDSLKRIAANQGMSVAGLIENIRVGIGANKELMQLLGAESGDAFDPIRIIPAVMGATVLSELLEDGAKLTIPIIGSLVAGGISFTTTCASLTYMLNQYEKMASACLDIVFSEEED